MKSNLQIPLLLSLFICFNLTAAQKDPVKRLNKKDKQDLVAMFTEFIDGMERNEMPIKDQIESRWWFWESPMMRIEKSIDQLNEMAQQIQNFIVDVTVNEDSESKKCCHKILKRLELFEGILQQMIQELVMQREVLGNLDDESVGEQDFNSVQDIDDAELSVISWLKSIYREQLKDKFIS